MYAKKVEDSDPEHGGSEASPRGVQIDFTQGIFANGGDNDVDISARASDISGMDVSRND